MVLGLGSKGKKGSPVQFVFGILVQEVKPWPSKSLPPSSRLMIQWQRGDKRSGRTKCISPEQDNRLALNESFKIPATLYRIPDSKHSKAAAAAPTSFQKKCIVFNLFEAHAGRSSPRGQPLGRAVLDISEHADKVGAVTLDIPLAVARKDFSSLGTPKLFLTISKDGTLPPISINKVASPVTSSSGNTPMQGEGDTISARASDDDIASFTDDDDDRSVSSAPSATKTEVPPAAKETSERRSEKVQRILSSVALASPAKTAAMAAASKRFSSSRASSSSDFETSDDGLASPLPAVAKAPEVVEAPKTKAIKGDAKPPEVVEAPKTKAIKGDAKAPEVVEAPKTKAIKGDAKPPEVVEAPKTKAFRGDAKPPEFVEAPKTLVSKAPVEMSKDKITSTSRNEETRKPDVNVLEAARMKFAETAGERTEKLDRKAVEEARLRASIAEAKTAAAEERARLLNVEIESLKGELRDAAALEASLYSAVAEHGSNPHKFHSPARRLARIVIYACKHYSAEGRASSARNCASGLVVVARACDNDVSRLTFWWSNVVALRGMIFQALGNVESASKDGEGTNDWSEVRTLTSTLERIESWIFGRIVESVWWQSLTPHMQASVEHSSPPSPSTSEEVSVVTRLKKSVRGLLTTDIADSRQGTLSIEVWKSAFLDVLQRLCPVRAGGHDCGCLRVATKLIIEQCVARLDVAMFNAILRDTSENTPTDPVSDPFRELSVLPISPDGVSFGGGAQLKNVISTWSTWLFSQTTDSHGDLQEVLDKASPYFTLLRAMSDLLMLPKDILMDKSVRKEVCPALSLLLIRRILSKFVPDEYSPEPVPPSLVAALNAEISMERQRVGEADISSAAVVMASAPPVVYFPPSPSVFMADLSPDPSSKLSRASSILRKGHMSDDELEEIESPLFLLFDATNDAVDEDVAALQAKDASAKRYQLLREAWAEQQQ